MKNFKVEKLPLPQNLILEWPRKKAVSNLFASNKFFLVGNKVIIPSGVTTRSSSAAAAGSSSAEPPAGVAAAASSSGAGPPAGVAASSGSSPAANQPAAGAANRPAAGAANQAAAGAENDGGGRVVAQHPNHPRRGLLARTFFVSEAGERFHNWRNCNGLRKARYTKEVMLCTTCVDPSFELGGEMYTSANDDLLHSSWAHAVAFTADPSRTLTPCKVCMR